MPQPLTYSYNSVSQEVVCAEDAISSLPGILDRLGSTRAMVVCGPSILEQSNVVQRVLDALGDRCVGLFSGVAPHSPVHTLDEAMRLAKDSTPAALVSVGGGSTHDTAKGIATLLGEGGKIHDHQVIFEPPDKIIYPTLSSHRVPIVAVSTTMGVLNSAGAPGSLTKTWAARCRWPIPGASPAP